MIRFLSKENLIREKKILGKAEKCVLWVERNRGLVASRKDCRDFGVESFWPSRMKSVARLCRRDSSLSFLKVYLGRVWLRQ